MSGGLRLLYDVLTDALFAGRRLQQTLQAETAIELVSLVSLSENSFAPWLLLFRSTSSK